MLNRLGLPYTKHRIKHGVPVLSTFLYLQNRISFDHEMDMIYQKFREWDKSDDVLGSMVNWIHRVDEYFNKTQTPSAFPAVFEEMTGLGPQNRPMPWFTADDEYSLLDVDIGHVVFNNWVLISTEASDRPYVYKLN